jgi:hypothetical protein
VTFLISNCGLLDPNYGLVTVEETTTTQEVYLWTCRRLAAWREDLWRPVKRFCCCHFARNPTWRGSRKQLMEHKSLHGTFHQISVILREKLNFQLKYVE